MTEKVRFNHFMELLTDFEANGSFADVKANVTVLDEPQHAWYVRATDLENKSDPFQCKWVNEHSHNFLRKTELFGNELLIAKRGEIGKVYLFQKPSIIRFATLAPNLYLIKLKERELAQYLFYYFISNKGKKSLLRINASSTIGALYKDDVKKLNIDFHTNAAERKFICNTLSCVDQKINLLTKKKEALETYKKGLMQKIFSQEIRFKREDGTDYPEWGIQTLDKLCSKCKSGGTPKSTVAEYYNGNIPFLAISDITEQGKYLRSTSKSISELGIENSASWIVPKHSLIYSMYASVGFVSINLIPLATSQAVLNLIVDERICLTEYLYYWLYQLQKNVHVYVTTGTQGNLNAQTVKSFQVDLPSIMEQEKIILTLSKIDEQISLMHTQIENAATLKKGLLQQMFV